MPDGSHADSLAGAVHCLGDVVPKGDRLAVPVGLRPTANSHFGAIPTRVTLGLLCLNGRAVVARLTDRWVHRSVVCRPPRL